MTSKRCEPLGTQREMPRMARRVPSKPEVQRAVAKISESLRGIVGSCLIIDQKGFPLIGILLLIRLSRFYVEIRRRWEDSRIFSGYRSEATNLKLRNILRSDLFYITDRNLLFGSFRSRLVRILALTGSMEFYIGIKSLRELDRS